MIDGVSISPRRLADGVIQSRDEAGDESSGARQKLAGYRRMRVVKAQMLRHYEQGVCAAGGFQRRDDLGAAIAALLLEFPRNRCPAREPQTAFDDAVASLHSENGAAGLMLFGQALPLPSVVIEGNASMPEGTRERRLETPELVALLRSSDLCRKLGSGRAGAADGRTPAAGRRPWVQAAYGRSVPCAAARAYSPSVSSEALPPAAVVLMVKVRSVTKRAR